VSGCGYTDHSHVQKIFQENNNDHNMALWKGEP